jgi:hypothetical protein
MTNQIAGVNTLSRIGLLPIGGQFSTTLSLNTSSGVISGNESGATQTTTYNFTIRATDAQSQTADRAFSITITTEIGNAARFGL